jgi:hypothetical protein
MMNNLMMNGSHLKPFEYPMPVNETLQVIAGIQDKTS